MSTKHTIKAPNTGMKYHVEIHPDFWKTYNAYYDQSSPEQKEHIQNEVFDLLENKLLGDVDVNAMFISTKVVEPSGKIVSGIRIYPLNEPINGTQNIINTFLVCIFLLFFVVKCCRIDDSLNWFIVFAPAIIFIVYNIILAFIQFTDWDGNQD
jgi:hypothetical protein